jgi:cell division protein FtsB
VPDDGTAAEARTTRRRRRTRIAIGITATAIAAAIGTSVFVIPMKAWLVQRDQLATSRAQLAKLDAANDRLQGAVDALKTQRGVIEAAREDLGAVREREKVFRVLELPTLTADMPTGWLYPTVQTLLMERAGEVGASTAGTSPATPTSAPAVDTTVAP